MPSEQRCVWMVRREKGSLALPIVDPEVAQVYKDRGWEVERPDSPDFNLARWLVATRPRRRRRS